MRLNVYIASSTGLSRRAADRAIEEGRVLLNGHGPGLGQQVGQDDIVTLDGRAITPDVNTLTIMLNKPVDYVCSRAGQGSKTIYDLIPEEYHYLKPVGRLDKNSSGLLLLTNDGELANQLTHPRYQKTKVYEVKLDRSLSDTDRVKVSEKGVALEDGLSKFKLEQGNNASKWTITMSEGRNRQIRRTFSALGYRIIRLHRTQFGEYQLGLLAEGQIREG